ncbi:unnamed protein product [Cochlearia groenlandica]
MIRCTEQMSKASFRLSIVNHLNPDGSDRVVHLSSLSGESTISHGDYSRWLFLMRMGPQGSTIFGRDLGDSIVINSGPVKGLGNVLTVQSLSGESVKFCRAFVMYIVGGDGAAGVAIAWMGSGDRPSQLGFGEVSSDLYTQEGG